MISAALACIVRLAALGGLAEGPIAHFGEPDLTVEDAGWQGVPPSLQLSTGFFTNGADAPDGRSVLTEMLRAESHDPTLSYFAAVGAVSLFEAGGQGGSHRTTRVSNATVGGRYYFERGLPSWLRADVGLGTVLGLANTTPSPQRRIARLAYVHAMAMEGGWDAWMWMPIAVGVFLPARLAAWHHLGRWSIWRRPSSSPRAAKAPAPTSMSRIRAACSRRRWATPPRHCPG
jgi:hypothetical protein